MENTMVHGIDLNVLYTILQEQASKRKSITYGDLSTAYSQKTGIYHEPHGTWDYPLGNLNNLLHTKKLPALSSIVVLADTLEPGKGFWGSSPGIPAWLSHDGQRMQKLLEIQDQVYGTKWPHSLPTK